MRYSFKLGLALALALCASSCVEACEGRFFGGRIFGGGRGNCGGSATTQQQPATVVVQATSGPSCCGSSVGVPVQVAPTRVYVPSATPVPHRIQSAPAASVQDCPNGNCPNATGTRRIVR